MDTTFKKREKIKNIKTIQNKHKKVLMMRSSHRSSNKEKSQYSIIFVLASQYCSHSVLLDNAVQLSAYVGWCIIWQKILDFFSVFVSRSAFINVSS